MNWLTLILAALFIAAVLIALRPPLWRTRRLSLAELTDERRRPDDRC